MSRSRLLSTVYYYESFRERNDPVVRFPIAYGALNDLKFSLLLDISPSPFLGYADTSDYGIKFRGDFCRAAPLFLWGGEIPARPQDSRSYARHQHSLGGRTVLIEC